LPLSLLGWEDESDEGLHRPRSRSAGCVALEDRGQAKACWSGAGTSAPRRRRSATRARQTRA